MGKVKLKEKALAKTHRPTRLFNANTCPIIGSNAMGELLIEVTPDGLRRLAEEISSGTTKRHLHNISTLESIGPFSRADVLLTEHVTRIKKDIMRQRSIKVELIKFSDPDTNKLAHEVFFRTLRTLGCNVKREWEYSPTLRLFEVFFRSIDALDKISELPIVRRISFFPRYHSLETRANAVPLQPSDMAIHPLPGQEYPVAGVLDSGIPRDHKQLSSWIIGREDSYVPDEYRNESHGTFVGGILVHSHILNPTSDDAIPGCMIFDACIMPNWDRNHGPVESITEQELIERIEDVVRRHHKHIRVWNLSLGTDEKCTDFGVTDLAAKLDTLADQFDVIFVIACGNYNAPPLRTWPPTRQCDDRITAPADSVRNISVGSIAASDNAFTIVKRGEPSPFSRRGPGPSFIVKPDLVHIGGNTDEYGNPHGQGVKSWSPNGEIVEDVGTSYAAPRVTRLLAGVESSLNDRPSRLLLKALVIHSARLPYQNRRPTGELLHYYGFGTPDNILEILTCSRSSATIIWEAEVPPRAIFSIDDFPYPRCLLTENGWIGDVSMTLVYDPPLDHSRRFEYCRLNINAHLGLYRRTKDGALRFKGMIPPDATWEDRYEKALIEHGFKWSPVKVYHRRITKGVKGEHWRLYLDYLVRSEESNTAPQPFVLIVTISDPAGQADVYSDISQQLRARFVSNDLTVKQRVRAAIGF